MAAQLQGIKWFSAYTRTLMKKFHLIFFILLYCQALELGIVSSSLTLFFRLFYSQFCSLTASVAVRSRYLFPALFPTRLLHSWVHVNLPVNCDSSYRLRSGSLGINEQSGYTTQLPPHLFIQRSPKSQCNTEMFRADSIVTLRFGSPLKPQQLSCSHSIHY